MFRNHHPVRETQAEGPIEQVYHDFKQTLRIYGVPFVIREWAGWEHFFVLMWQAVRPNAETQAFEDAADRLRLTALHGAARLGKPGAAARVAPGESEAFQIRAALDLYYYTYPKVLVLTSAVRSVLDGELSGAFATTMPTAAEPEKIERGIPPAMFPMEMEEEHPPDQALRTLFAEITETFGSETVTDDYRTLALWPEYLDAAWMALKPIMRRSEYETEARALLDLARRVAGALPFPFSLDRNAIEESGEDLDRIIAAAHHFEALLTRLLLNISVLQLDWKELHFLEVSPFPAKLRQTRPVEVTV
jgi:hypothetical protein